MSQIPYTHLLNENNFKTFIKQVIDENEKLIALKGRFVEISYIKKITNDEYLVYFGVVPTNYDHYVAKFNSFECQMFSEENASKRIIINKPWAKFMYEFLKEQDKLCNPDISLSEAYKTQYNQHREDMKKLEKQQADKNYSDSII